MVGFAGWEMPIEYSGITDEHMAVRTRAGLFDVSHMGEIEIAGRDALAAVQRVSCNDASRLQPGQAQYSGLLTPGGAFVDDVLVYRLASSHFLLVVNASNTGKDSAWIAEHIHGMGDAVAVDASSRYALLALQGPLALDVLQPLTGVELSAMRYYSFAHGEVAGVLATISRTGYTGEDGFEMFVLPQAAGVARRLAGFELLEPGIARPGHDVYVDHSRVARVTSGTRTPYVKKSIGMAYLPIERSTPGSEIEIDIRGRRVRARVVPLPFYKRRKQAVGGQGVAG